MEKMTEDNEIPMDAGALTAAGVVDPAQALRNLGLVRSRIGAGATGRLFPELLAVLRRTGDPDMALNQLERYIDGLQDPAAFDAACSRSVHFLANLVTVFGASRFLSSFLLSDPVESTRFLSDPYFIYAPERRQLARSLSDATAGDPDEPAFFRMLRQFRKREMLRIALRDLTGRTDLAGTVAELSDLAEVCIERAHAWADRELRNRHGRPVVIRPDGTTVHGGLAVIAMGKLGGGELNFSSDVDLMYVYTADGETEGVAGPDGAPTGRIANHQYFVKLAEKVSAAIGQNTEDGFVFRVDLRLRPEGQRGPIAQSLGGYEIYYESWGQTWERSALIKARPVGGDAAVGREFLARITPFVYRKYLDFSAIAEIREMKVKINREVQMKGRAQRDVKLGYGGIREIEFLVQALQLIYGGRDRTVRERGTMKALHILAQKGLLTYQEIADLTKAYVFLRTVEHRLQMLSDLQTQTLPAAPADLRVLARRCGYLEPDREAEQLLRDYTLHTRKVRTIYDDLLGQDGETPQEGLGTDDLVVLLDPASAEQDAAAVLTQAGFRDPSRAYRNITLLREGQAFVHQTPRGRRVFNELFPALFREAAASPDPDMALHHLESFLAAQGSWDAFRALLQQDPRVPHALVSVFGNSEYFSRLLVRSPGLIEELLDAGGEAWLGSRASLGRGLADALSRAAGIADRLDALRRFKHRAELRIGMADLTGTIPLPAVCRGLSRLADVCLEAALDLAAAETGRRCGIAGSCAGLAVIGAGKLGGRELIYGSDLDILFVYDEALAAAPPPGTTVSEHLSRVAEKTISYLASMTREGAAYRVDTRLRPTGSKGPLVQSIAAFRSFFAGPAETWERQSLVNARFVAGDRQVGRVLAGHLQELIYREADPAALASDIRAMRKRMQDERGREDGAHYNIKQGQGGLVDIEFLAQYLVLRHGARHPRVRVPGTINELTVLRAEGLLPPADGAELCRSYLFFRKIESRLRVVANQSTSVLSRAPGNLRALAMRMGFRDGNGSAGEQFLAELESTRVRVRERYDRLLQP